MSTPDVGTFGVAAAAGLFLVAAFDRAGRAADPRPLLLAGLWCASRTAMAVIAATQPYARTREGGLASAFLGRPFAWAALAVGGPSAAVARAMAVWKLPGRHRRSGRCHLGPRPRSAVTALARRRLGGFTGDVLGAAGVILETVGLIVAAAKW